MLALVNSLDFTQSSCWCLFRRGHGHVFSLVRDLLVGTTLTCNLPIDVAFINGNLHSLSHRRLVALILYQHILTVPVLVPIVLASSRIISRRLFNDHFENSTGQLYIYSEVHTFGVLFDRYSSDNLSWWVNCFHEWISFNS